MGHQAVNDDWDPDLGKHHLSQRRTVAKYLMKNGSGGRI
jgi:hypothetical protein